MIPFEEIEGYSMEMRKDTMCATVKGVADGDRIVTGKKTGEDAREGFWGLNRNDLLSSREDPRWVGGHLGW